MASAELEGGLEGIVLCGAEPWERAQPVPWEIEDLAQSLGPGERGVGELAGAAPRQTGKEQGEELAVGESGHFGEEIRDTGGRTKRGHIGVERSAGVRLRLVHAPKAIRLTAGA